MPVGSGVVEKLWLSVQGGEIAVVDLSHSLSADTPMIELPPPLVNAPGWTLTPIARYDDAGPMYYWNEFSGSEHMGTHFDAPVHWITGRHGMDVSSIAGTSLLGPACVIDRVGESDQDPDYLLTTDDVRTFESEHGSFRDGTWVLLRTGWASRHTDPTAFVNADEHGSHWPGMTVECAEYLATTAIAGYGVEHIGIDWGMAHTLDPVYPAHHFLLGAGKFGLASLANLDKLPITGALLIAAPLRIVGGSGSPARVYALVPRSEKLLGETT